jgi:hypothetical protein
LLACEVMLTSSLDVVFYLLSILAKQCFSIRKVASGSSCVSANST